MATFLDLSYLNPTNISSEDNSTNVQCPIKIPAIAAWDPSSFNAAAKISTLLAVTVNLITMPFTVFLNALVIFIVWKNPSLQIERVLVLAYLAFADFLVGLICKPLFIVREVLQLKTNNINCEIDAAYFLSMLIISVVPAQHLLLVTYERYVAIIYPYKYPTRITVKRLTYATIVLWAQNTTVTLLFFVQLTVGVTMRYMDILGSIMFATIAIFLLYSYVRIFATIRQTNRQVNQLHQNANINNPRTQQNHKGAITSALLLGCFFVSIIPVLCTLSLKQVLRPSFSKSLFLSLRPWVQTFINLGSFINPIIYGLRVGALREKCLQLLGFNSNLNNAP